MTEQQEKTRTNLILLNASRSKLESWFGDDNAFDSKAMILFAVGSAVAVFYLGIIFDLLPAIKEIAPAISQKYLILILLAPLVFLACSAWYLYKIFVPKTYHTGLVNLLTDSKGYKTKSEEKLSEQLITDYSSAYEYNNKILWEKTRHFNYVLACLLASVGLIVLYEFAIILLY